MNLYSFGKCLLSTYYVSGTGDGVINKKVSNCKGSEVLPCLQESKSACPVFRCSQKTDSWTRDVITHRTAGTAYP